jgi:hypothetical protein
MRQKIGWALHAMRTGTLEFVVAVTTGKKAYTERSSTAGHGIGDLHPKAVSGPLHLRR